MKVPIKAEHPPQPVRSGTVMLSGQVAPGSVPLHLLRISANSKRLIQSLASPLGRTEVSSKSKKNPIFFCLKFSWRAKETKQPLRLLGRLGSSLCEPVLRAPAGTLRGIGALPISTHLWEPAHIISLKSNTDSVRSALASPCHRERE